MGLSNNWGVKSKAGLYDAWAALGKKIQEAKAAKAEEEQSGDSEEESEKFDKGAGRWLQRAPAFIVGSSSGQAGIAEANRQEPSQEEDGDSVFRVGIGGDKIAGFASPIWNGNEMLGHSGFGKKAGPPGIDAQIIFP